MPSVSLPRDLQARPQPMNRGGQADPVQIVEAPAGFGKIAFHELWSSRELLSFFIWRDIKIRYKQTVLGAAWAILQPLLTALVFTIFFGKVAGIRSDGVPYALFSYTGLILWTFFSQGISLASNSLVNSAQLITKVYFPRMLVPLAAVLAGLVDFFVASIVLGVMLAITGVMPGLRLLLLPVVLLLVLTAAAGVSFWLSALNVLYRDIRFVLPFLVQIWLFLTPVIYPMTEIRPTLEAWGLPSWIIGLNPMAGPVEAFRWALLGLPTDPWQLLLVSGISGIAMMLSGALYFRHMERIFADVV